MQWGVSRFTICAALAVVLCASLSVNFASAVEGATQVVVRPGDTLGAISRQHGVTIQQLAEANGLKNPDVIRAGQVLQIAAALTGPGTAEGTSGKSAIVVKAGDTLWKIAQAYGVRVADLGKANGISNLDLIVAGQRLVLPEGAAPAAVGASGSSKAADAASPSQLTASSLPAEGAGGQVVEVLEIAAQRHGVDPVLAKALAWNVSRWNPDAGSPESASGVMQLTPATQKWLQTDVLRAPPTGDKLADNVEAGVAYLGHLLKSFDTEEEALGAYLQGPGSVTSGGVSAGTRQRVSEILATAAYLRGDSSAVASVAAPAQQATQPQTSSVADEPSGSAAYVVADSTPDKDLEAQLEALVSAQPQGVLVGVVGYNLDSQRDIWINGDEIFAAASVLKVGVLVAVYEEVKLGNMTLDGDVADDLDRMLTANDNEAANRLLQRVGFKRVNQILESYGLTDTVIRSRFSTSVDPSLPLTNETSASDMEFLLELIATGQVASKAASAEMLALLGATGDGTKLLAPIPDDVQVEHKSGWYDGVANDVAVVHAPAGTYVLAVFTSGAPSQDEGNQIIAAISELVYQAWGA